MQTEYRQQGRQTDNKAKIQTARQTDRQQDKHTDNIADRQKPMYTGIHTETLLYKHLAIERQYVML